jgi:hypothetical protein
MVKSMESGKLVAFDDHWLRPSPTSLSTLMDSLADIDARRPSNDRFASEGDAVRFEAMRTELHRVLSAEASTQERRAHARLPCDLWVRVSHGGRVRPGVIEDLGVGGVFVSCLLQPELDESVVIMVDPREDLAAPLCIEGRVAWLGSEGRVGFGVCFDRSRDAVAAVDRMVTLLTHRIAPQPA